MSRCKACDHILTLVDYTVKPREHQEDIPEGVEEELCVRCISISFFGYSFTSDHNYTLQDATTGVTDPIPTESQLF